MIYYHAFVGDWVCTIACGQCNSEVVSIAE